ncbi:MAG TPA: hypothetical protein VIK89_01335, partial [Cytophagaceae bacterium]
PTAHYTVFDELLEFSDIFWVINVSNCRATLPAGRPNLEGMEYRKVSIRDKYLSEQLEYIMLASIEANGGAINISGF